MYVDMMSTKSRAAPLPLNISMAFFECFIKTQVNSQLSLLACSGVEVNVFSLDLWVFVFALAQEHIELFIKCPINSRTHCGVVVSAMVFHAQGSRNKSALVCFLD